MTHLPEATLARIHNAVVDCIERTPALRRRFVARFLQLRAIRIAEERARHPERGL